MTHENLEKITKLADNIEFKDEKMDFDENSWTKLQCQHCQGMVENDIWKEHTKLCQETLKHIDEQTCLICLSFRHFK